MQRHAALVIGNLCQTDDHRAIAGVEGAVEAMFALCDANDEVVRANALWALGNLAWDPHNQVECCSVIYYVKCGGMRMSLEISQQLVVGRTWPPSKTAPR